MSAPPPAKALSKGKQAALANVLKDKENIDKIRAKGKESIFFDKDSPEVRKRRENARAEYEKIIDTIHPGKPFWARATIAEFTKDYLSTVIQITKGRLEEKPRVDILYQKKEGIYWWAVRLISDFATSYIEWHTLVNGHIAYLALTMGLSKLHHKKHNLTDMEMELLFGLIMKKTTSVPNFKQHYLAWLLVWVTSIRPGSFTVCPGYRAGDSLGAEGMVREIDETLRFSDCSFLRVDDEIRVVVEFKFNKGQRNPYTRKLLVGERKFTFIPCSGDRYFLDVGTILIAIALERGLFAPIHTYEELLKLDLLNIPKDPVVDAQAVFLASDVGKNELLPNKAMREAALNPVLRGATFDLGLWSRNTIYSLRRTAILETRRSEGTEVAREIAGHTMGSRAILTYDVVGLADFDITALRMGEESLHSRDEIRKMFAQANVARVDFTVELQAELKNFVEEKMRVDEQFIAAERTVQEALDAIWASCDTEEKKTLELALTIVEGGTEDSQEASMLRENLEAAIRKRKETRKTLRRQLTNEFKKSALEKHQKTIKASTTQSGATHTHGALPESMSTAHAVAAASSKSIVDTLGASVEASIDRLAVGDEDALDEEDGREDVDASVVSEDGENVSGEPAQWAEFGQAEVDVLGDVVTTASSETRAMFIRRFVQHHNAAVKDVKCLLCQLDDTCTREQKDLIYLRKADLDRHLRSAFHTRAAAIKRARTD